MLPQFRDLLRRNQIPHHQESVPAEFDVLVD
jgi:hypothetical protein